MNKLSVKEATDKYTPIVEKSGIFRLKEVISINHKPHPFMIGTRHITHASEHYGGMLGEATLKAIPCAMRNCCASFEDHTCDTVLPLQLIRDATKDEAQKAMQEMTKAGMEEDGIDGFVFIESEFEFLEN